MSYHDDVKGDAPRCRYLSLLLGNGVVFDIDCRDRNTKAAAKEFNDLVNVRSLDPTSPEGYAKVMADPALLAKHQDAINDCLYDRIVDVRNALRDQGWQGEPHEKLSKAGIEAAFCFMATEIGGENIEKYDNFSTVRNGNYILAYSLNGIGDDLTKTPDEFVTHAMSCLSKAIAVNNVVSNALSSSQMQNLAATALDTSHEAVTETNAEHDMDHDQDHEAE